MIIKYILAQKVFSEASDLIERSKTAQPDDLVKIAREARRLLRMAERLNGVEPNPEPIVNKLLMYLRRRALYFASRCSDPWCLGRIHTVADILRGAIDVEKLLSVVEKRARALGYHMMLLRKVADYDARTCKIYIYIDNVLKGEVKCATRPDILQQVEEPEPEKIYTLMLWMEPGRDEVVWVKMRS